MNKHVAIFFIVLVLSTIILILLVLPKTPIGQPSPIPSTSISKNVDATLGAQTKSINCQIVNSLPDPACTPGATFPNVTKEQVCTYGYAKSVRNVPVSTKEKVYAEYNIASHTAGEYEVDHFISLELGGSNDISNLWPEAASPYPGFHEKDKVEDYLHNEVCNDTITLSQAQYMITHDWVKIYQQIAP